MDARRGGDARCADGPAGWAYNTRTYATALEAVLAGAQAGPHRHHSGCGRPAVRPRSAAPRPVGAAAAARLADPRGAALPAGHRLLLSLLEPTAPRRRPATVPG